MVGEPNSTPSPGGIMSSISDGSFPQLFENVLFFRSKISGTPLPSLYLSQNKQTNKQVNKMMGIVLEGNGGGEAKGEKFKWNITTRIFTKTYHNQKIFVQVGNV